MTIAQKLNDAVAAVCPIDGVSIGDEADKATWAIRYAAIATVSQRSAGAEALAAFDLQAAQQAATDEQVRTASDEAERAAGKLDSTILFLINQTRAEWASWAQANFPSLTAAERTRRGVICWLLAVAVRRLMRN